MKQCLECRSIYDEERLECPQCGDRGYRLVRVVGEEEGKAPTGQAEGGYRRSVDYGGERNPYMGWIIFILVFVVGNAILYATTGIFLIPLPRR